MISSTTIPTSPPLRRALPCGAAAFGLLVTLCVSMPLAHAAGPSKEECLDAHGKGQDARDKGQLADARALFLTCAQPVCPSLISSDCARFAEDTGRLVPSVTFAARDGKGADLPDTQVFVDDKLVASRLDDGKAFELNPGKHSVRFSHEGKDVVQQVVVSQGERGRALVASFGEAPPVNSGRTDPLTQPPAPSAPSRSAAPLVVTGLGAALLATGAVLLVVGNGKIPDNCSLSSKQCAAPPGDPSFSRAHSGASLMNDGWIVGAVGLAGLGGGLIWYFARSPGTEPRAVQGLAPWVVPGAGGLSLSGRL